LVLSLASNPSTGFSWKISAIDSTILKQAGEPTFKSAPDAAGKAGAGGTQIWTFDVKAAGSTPLALEYRRSWESDSVPAAQTFRVTIEATK
jgi:predicted secreted protein